MTMQSDEDHDEEVDRLIALVNFVSDRAKPENEAQALKKLLARINLVPDFAGIAAESPTQTNALGDTPLHVAACWGDCEAIKLLLDNGADIDAKGEYGYTPLHIAVSQGMAEAAVFLISQGASCEIRQDFGSTPLQCARDPDSAVLRACLEAIALRTRR